LLRHGWSDCSYKSRLTYLRFICRPNYT
jgi:hypothetical protein